MGIVNASPDSFSDAGVTRTLEQRLGLARQLLEAGADVIDIGGESGVTNRPAVDPAEEIERVAPLIARVAGELGALVSVDTYKPAVARAAIDAGAAIINDVSGLRDPGLADVCAARGAGLVVMHTRAAPKHKLLDHSLDGRIVEDLELFLRERIELALGRGMASEQLMLDPGPDFGKTPAQTVEALRALERLHAFGRPLLLAVSRKDFVGAITGGKLTTWRRMAKLAVDRLVERDGRDAPCRTAEIPLGQPVDPGALSAPAGVAAASVTALASRYGHAAEQVLALAGERPELAEPIVPGLPDLLAEAAFSARNEQAATVGDVLLRRTRLGLLAGREVAHAGSEAPRRIAEVLAGELGWDPSRTEEEVEAFHREALAEGVGLQ